MIVDFYASYYDMNVLDRQSFPKDSMEAKGSLIHDNIAVELVDYIMFLNRSECSYYLGVNDCQQYIGKSIIVPLVIENRSKTPLNYSTNIQIRLISCFVVPIYHFTE